MVPGSPWPDMRRRVPESTPAGTPTSSVRSRSIRASNNKRLKELEEAKKVPENITAEVLRARAKEGREDEQEKERTECRETLLRMIREAFVYKQATLDFPKSHGICR